ncbi:MAG: ABC transporter substrate-binding protein [Treponema sp.]|nr:ABC transporter substrate-binding protein [Treponema sp.]
MYLVGDKPAEFDDVYAKINEILEQKLNCSLKVDWLSWGEHSTKYSLLFSSGEPFDLIFTATSWCHFEQTVGLGGFKTIPEEAIKNCAPGIYSVMPKIAWEQATVDGNIYMIPANFIEVTPDVVAIRGDWMKNLGYDDINSWDSLSSFFVDCAKSGRYGTTNGGDSFFWLWFESKGYDVVSGAPQEGTLVLYNQEDPNDIRLRYVVDWEEFADYCRTAKKLADAGAWPDDVLNATGDRQDGLLSGRAASMIWNTDSCATYANQANKEHPDWDINIYNIMPNVHYTATKYINGGIGINVASKNPGRALMVINEFATNQEIQDLAQLGIRGKHWEAVGDKEYTLTDTPYNASNYWGWRNKEIMRSEHKGNPSAVDQRKKELDDYFLSHVKSVDHVLDGFRFDSSKVSTQYAAVEAALGSYLLPLRSGLVDDVDKTLAEFRDAMNAAGMKDVMAEMQRQVDEFVAAKGK